jgi:amino acid transporter
MEQHTAPAEATSSSGHLKRALGAWDLTWLCVVAIANLNVVPVIAASGPTTMWLWMAALLFFFLPQGITVIELSHRYPGEGGLYLWAKEMFGDFHGFMCGWCYWTTNMFFIPTLLFYLAGILAYAGGRQIAGLAENRVFFFLLTVGLLWLVTFANIRGVGVGKWVNNAGGYGTLIAASILIALGAATILQRGISIPASSFGIEKIDWPIISSFGVICFGLVGLELGPVMGDEIRDPRKNVPRGIFRGGVLSGLLYIGSTLALLLAVPQSEVKVVQGVLQAVDKMTVALRQSWILTPLAFLMAAAITGSTSAWLSGSARIIFVSGIDRYLPKVFGRVHPKFSTPHIALIAMALLSSLLVSMSFIGASVKEAYLTLLDLAVVLQMLSYLYLYATMAAVAFGKHAGDGLYSKTRIRFAAVSGLTATLVGMVVAFVPSRQIESIWRFEFKMISTCAVFLALAGGLFYYYSRSRAPERAAPALNTL